MPQTYKEKKGSLTLRADHLEYGRATLVANWHQARESEPKDFNIKKADSGSRSLHLSTYKRIGNVTDGSLPGTTTFDHLEQINLKNDYEEHIVKYPMINGDNFDHMNLERHTGAPVKGYGSVLPRHPPGHNKRYLDSTYRLEYKAPFPASSKDQKVAEEKNLTKAYKKCHSQFTDVDDYRRHGQNTWFEESGIYANTNEKHEILKTTNFTQGRLLCQD